MDDLEKLCQFYERIEGARWEVREPAFSPPTLSGSDSGAILVTAPFFGDPDVRPQPLPETLTSVSR